MRNMIDSPAALCMLAVGFALPLAAQSAVPPQCKQIVSACAGAGFVKGDAKQGYGLWKDCIDPIMRGTAQPANADKPLPAVPAEVIAACKQADPNFGEGKRAAAPPAPTAPPKGT